MDIAREFGVSTQALAYRLVNIGVLKWEDANSIAEIRNNTIVGNTYAGASVIGLTDILDHSKPGDRVLLASFGSGAGSDAFSFVVTNKISEAIHKAPLTQDYIDRSVTIGYGKYMRWTKKIVKE